MEWFIMQAVSIITGFCNSYPNENMSRDKNSYSVFLGAMPIYSSIFGKIDIGLKTAKI